MTMTISEALKQMDGIAVFAADREALAVIRSRLEVTEEMVSGRTFTGMGVWR